MYQCELNLVYGTETVLLSSIPFYMGLLGIAVVRLRVTSGAVRRQSDGTLPRLSVQSRLEAADPDLDLHYRPGVVHLMR